MGSVSLRNIRKSYGTLEVLHGIDIDVANSEFVVLVGPSGCGKSTLLRSLAGLETISDGSIRIDDQVVNQLPPKSRDIAMVFQNYALYPHMTVADNMSFSLKMARMPKAESAKRVREAATILGLEPLLERYPRQLSGGQRQRVAMGRAIVRNPKVFLFDEPLSNLDAKLRVQVRAEIKELHHRLKSTIIYVTHDQIEAMTMADKIVVMRDGYVEQIGTPLELYDTPRNVFVAGFIGSPAMNFISSTVTLGRAEFGGEGSVPASHLARMEGSPITVGVRPEDFMISTGGFAATVVLVEPTGAETQLTARIGETTITVTTRERVTAAVGDQVRLSIPDGKAHFFDPDSGLAIR
jgi:multiple sugar transport system ATP-binding protein